MYTEDALSQTCVVCGWIRDMHWLQTYRRPVRPISCHGRGRLHCQRSSVVLGSTNGQGLHPPKRESFVLVAFRSVSMIASRRAPSDGVVAWVGTLVFDRCPASSSRTAELLPARNVRHHRRVLLSGCSVRGPFASIHQCPCFSPLPSYLDRCWSHGDGNANVGLARCRSLKTIPDTMEYRSTAPPQPNVRSSFRKRSCPRCPSRARPAPLTRRYRVVHIWHL